MGTKLNSNNGGGDDDDGVADLRVDLAMKGSNSCEPPPRTRHSKLCGACIINSYTTTTPWRRVDGYGV